MAGINNNGEITNAGRATVGKMAMEILANQENMLVDTLANLMHHCDQEGESFEEALVMATIHFEEEKAMEEVE